jgi:hypothetical protein
MFIQAMFMLNAADDIWSGQFTGSKERWVLARQILLSTRKS